MTKSIFYYLAKRLIQNIPKIKPIYFICKKYIDIFNGENNCDIRTNGESHFLKNNLEYCNVVFDVGANIGEWTKTALSINPKIKVHCFEPNKNTFNRLLSNNFSSNVFCNNFGLGSKKEKKILYVYHNSSAINSLYNRKILNNISTCSSRREKVLIDTLDNYCIEKGIKQIDFLKIDVEGHEFQTLKGVMNLLKKQRIKIIQFEYGSTYIDAKVFLRDIFQYFKNFNGYKFYKIFPKNIKWIKEYTESLDNFQYSNYLIIHNSVKDKIC